MSHINVFMDDGSRRLVKIRLRYQFNFFYYLPYVSLDDLVGVDPNAVGLFCLNEKGDKIAQGRRDGRIFLYTEENIPVDQRFYLLNCMAARSNNVTAEVDSIGSNCINIGHIGNPPLSMGDSCNAVAAITDRENMNNLRKRKT